jgi:hypothetical protein
VKKKSDKLPTGRPSTYSEATASLICERIADGESLRAICRDEAMPAKSTVFKWLSEERAFSDQYARAREAQADTMADEILEIADETAFDSIESEGGGLKPDSEWIARSRLRVDARKWLASKMAPKKYGDKITHAGDPDAPVALVLNGSDIHG